MNAHLGVLVELVGGDEVDGEDNLDVVGLGLREEGLDLLSTSGVVERGTDLCGSLIISRPCKNAENCYSPPSSREPS